MRKNKYLLIVILAISSTMTMAKITCETPRGAKVLDIGQQKVSIKQPFKEYSNRAVASLSSVRTKFVGKGFTKIVFHNGEKHIIHVEDKNQFSSLNDYLIVRSKEGHEMTYPLDCSN